MTHIDPSVLELAEANQDASGDIGTFARAVLKANEVIARLESHDHSPPPRPKGNKRTAHR